MVDPVAYGLAAPLLHRHQSAPSRSHSSAVPHGGNIGSRGLIFWCGEGAKLRSKFTDGLSAQKKSPTGGASM
uniref:Uncharacterized protein n=1 Tax=Leersia perrieri TaxID=77586 RepID=A0A0D9WPL6_9ORYZ